MKLVTRTYDENGSLFTEEEREKMREDIRTLRKLLPDDVAYNYMNDNMAYVETLAKEIGCDPPPYDEIEAMGEDGKLLAVLVRHGPYLGGHFRLRGPGKWEGAKENIIQIGKMVLGEKIIQEYLQK